MTRERFFAVQLLLIASMLLTAIYLATVTGSYPPPVLVKPTGPVTAVIGTPAQLSDYWINVEQISDKEVGDIFTINARTTIPVGDDVLVQVYSNSFVDHRRNKTGSEFQGAAGNVKVTRGNNDFNSTSFVVNSSAFSPDEYLVTESAINQEAYGADVFNIFTGNS